MNIRALAFWTKDKLLGKSRSKRIIKEIHKYSDAGDDNIEQLQRIVEWAVAEVSYYSNYKEKSFAQFPCITKKIIRDNFEDFKAKSFANDNLHAERTSGSTGTPFTIYQDSGKRIRAAADSLYMSENAGFRLGTKLYYVRVWTDLNKKSRIQCLLTNIVMQDSSSLSEDNMEEFLRKIESDSSEKSILSYANTITAIYRWMKETGRTTIAKISCIITMSESLPLEVKKGMQELFGCPVVSRYSNQECGLISQQRKGDEEYAINTASFFVEVLKLDTDEAAADGELGRIVITDLFNKAMPLIRYDTGDLGIMSHVSKSGAKGKYLAKVEGRSNDFIYSTSGEMLSPVSISVNMWKYNDIQQWQFIQNGEKDYEFRIKCNSNPYEKEQELVSEIKCIVGFDSHITVSLVEEIPLLKSGKRKYVINNLNN